MEKFRDQTVYIAILVGYSLFYFNLKVNLLLKICHIAPQHPHKSEVLGHNHNIFSTSGLCGIIILTVD